MVNGMKDMAEAAEYLSYSVGGLRKLIRRRAIRYFQASKHSPIKFRQEWLDEFIDANSVGPRTLTIAAATRKRKTPPKMDGVHFPNLAI